MHKEHGAAQPRRSGYLPDHRRIAVAVLLATTAVAATLTPPPAAAQVAADSRAYAIPAQSLSTALVQFGQTSGMQIFFEERLTLGHHSAGVTGTMDRNTALGRLLAGSGLSYRIHGANTVTIYAPAATAAPVSADGAVVLDRVIIQAGGSGTTEGSGSYASGSASIARGAQSLKEVPQSVTVVTRQTLQDQNLTTMSAAMAKTPGIVANREDSGAPTYYARGFKINNYQVDGLGTAYESSFRPDFDMVIYDRIEILRGAEGLFSGNGDPGGNVNLVRKRPTDDLQSSIALSSGSWQNNRVEADISGPLAFDGALRGRMVGAWQDRDFFYSPADEKNRVLYGILEYDLTPQTTISAGLSYQQRDGNKWFMGLPSYDDFTLVDIDRSRAMNADWTRANHEITEIFASAEHRFASGWTLRANAMRQRFNSQTLRIIPQGPVSRGTGAYEPGIDTLYEDSGNHSKAVDLSLDGSFMAWGREHRLLVGADWRDSKARQLGYELSSDGFPGTVTLDNFHEFSLSRPHILGPRTHWPAYGAEQKGIFARAQIEATDRLRFIVGGRYGSYKYSSVTDRYAVDGTLLSHSVTGYKDSGIFTPYAAVMYDVTPDWTAYASITDIYRAQANYQSGPPENPSPLNPITGRNLEIGAKGELLGGALNTAMSVYRIERTGEAASDPRYPYTPDDAGLACCYVEQGKIVSQGLELELSGEVTPDWHVFAGYTWNQNKSDDSDAVFSALTPRHMLKLWTSYDLPGDDGKWTIGGGVTVKSKHGNSGTYWVRGDDGWAEAPYTIRQGGYAVWDAHVHYRIDDDWQVALNVANLFDKTYYAAIGHPRAGNWYGEPRNVSLTLRGQF